MLRKSDPRFVALLEFCDSRPELLASPIVQMVKKVFIAVFYRCWCADRMSLMYFLTDSIDV